MFTLKHSAFERINSLASHRNLLLCAQRLRAQGIHYIFVPCRCTGHVIEQTAAV
jgi:hypothetical protein